MTTQDFVLICICLSLVVFPVTILMLTAHAKFCELCNPRGKYDDNDVTELSFSTYEKTRNILT